MRSNCCCSNYQASCESSHKQQLITTRSRDTPLFIWRVKLTSLFSSGFVYVKRHTRRKGDTRKVIDMSFEIKHEPSRGPVNRSFLSQLLFVTLNVPQKAFSKTSRNAPKSSPRSTLRKVLIGLIHMCYNLSYNRNVTLYQISEIGSSSLLMNVWDSEEIVRIYRNKENFYVWTQAKLSLQLTFLKIIWKWTHIILYSLYLIREN